MASCSDPMMFHQAEFHRISLSKRKCVVAAQQTAKLLHNLEDKKSLIYGFPWWQMISCLICASSILLVASICVNLDSESESEVFKDIDWLAVDEDAEVCLQVFQALSSNSNAARLALDMMQRLKKTRTISYGKFPRSAFKRSDAAVSLLGILAVSPLSLEGSVSPRLDFATNFSRSHDLAPRELHNTSENIDLANILIAPIRESNKLSFNTAHVYTRERN